MTLRPPHGPVRDPAGTPARNGSADPARLPDLALRSYGGSVLAASDESFAERQALIRPGRPAFQPGTFGPRGQVYDGWETRRRRDPGHDWAIVRLGMPGVIRGVVVDTAWFTGNYPPHAWVEACEMAGHPSVAELTAAAWTEIVPKSPLTGDSEHFFAVPGGRRYTHVRLNIHPDGGVARLRVHGEVVPDRALWADMPVDLAALENGALVTACSDEFYSSPLNVIAPGLPRHQAEGWETARRRDGGHDWLVVRLAAPGVIRLAELDTANLVYNAPGAAALHGADARGGGTPGEDAEWFDLLSRTALQPDTRHRFRLTGERVVTHVRLAIHPDGGMGRLRLYGTPAPPG
ncbi:putative allantoicase [Sphaerisporangium melleum]|uniref:Probable allantoicase n=1 Tax=Sphaerisporangium melleum TaxID=321316 RepID=A0A917RJ07_9ACTN|nr:allantoicase [Sphaerisporangium melleum]GGL09367.1 putative allantoicase [Sphaerisporangium melleum]GII67557.1 putative allantoicase [Sphaerisporangium melleum]